MKLIRGGRGRWGLLALAGLVAVQTGCSCPVSRACRDLATDAAATATGGVAGLAVVREGRSVLRGTVRLVRAVVPGL
ncbi:MAG: hypothetical protein WCK33_11900 [Phycisphaerae bacterium]